MIRHIIPLEVIDGNSSLIEIKGRVSIASPPVTILINNRIDQYILLYIPRKLQFLCCLVGELLLNKQNQ